MDGDARNMRFISQYRQSYTMVIVVERVHPDRRK
jgi:hypothetical protein